MRKIKGLLTVLILASTILSCSIDRIDDVPHIPIQTMNTEYVEAGGTTYPWGGYWIYFYADDVQYDEMIVVKNIEFYIKIRLNYTIFQD